MEYPQYATANRDSARIQKTIVASGMNRDQAEAIARQVKIRTKSNRRNMCAIFLNAHNAVVLVRGAGPQFDSNLFRYPAGLVGRYDAHAAIAAIVDDLLASLAEKKIAA